MNKARQYAKGKDSLTVVSNIGYYYAMWLNEQFIWIKVGAKYMGK